MTHMRLYAVVGFVGLVGTLAASERVTAQGQTGRPVKTVRLWVDRAGPGTSDLAEALQRVEDVAEVSIVGTTMLPIPRGASRSPASPTRFFEAIVLGTYKQTKIAGKGAQIVIEQPGGEVEESGEIVNYVDPSFPVLDKGGQYILYLKWNQYTGAFSIIYGPEGAFQVEGSRLRSPGHTPITLAQTGRSVEVFRGALRAAAAARPR